MTNTAELLAERDKTHGSFEVNAKISQDLKRLMQAMPCWNDLSDVHKEALHMISLKLARILSGQADYDDHFLDIAGYSTLAARACTQKGLTSKDKAIFVYD